MEIIIAIILIFVLCVILIYNSILSKKNKLLKSYSTMDVMLKKRYDLIPNIVETIKGYTKYEQDILSKITNLRKTNNSTIEENIKNDEEYSNVISNIYMLAEKYPDLKASDNFIHLQKVLVEIEEQISAARRTYNAHVEKYNTFISYFPLNIIAKFFGFRKYEFFEINSIQKENVKIKSEDIK